MTDTGKRFTTAAGAIGHERLRRAFERLAAIMQRNAGRVGVAAA